MTGDPDPAPPSGGPATLAIAADIPALHALIERAYRGQTARGGWTHEADLLDGERTDRATLARIIADPRERLLIARDGDAIVACVQVSERGAVGYLGLLAVDPARQAAGLGRRMIVAAEAVALRFGARTLELGVLTQRGELIAYYQRRGYRLTGERRPFPISLDPPFELAVLARSLAP